MPKVGSGSVDTPLSQGSFDGGTGGVFGLGTGGQKLRMFENISAASIQGVEAANYTASLSLLQNGDEYEYECEYEYGY